MIDQSFLHLFGGKCRSATAPSFQRFLNVSNRALLIAQTNGYLRSLQFKKIQKMLIKHVPWQLQDQNGWLRWIMMNFIGGLWSDRKSVQIIRILLDWDFCNHNLCEHSWPQQYLWMNSQLAFKNKWVLSVWLARTVSDRGWEFSTGQLCEWWMLKWKTFIKFGFGG